MVNFIIGTLLKTSRLTCLLSHFFSGDDLSRHFTRFRVHLNEDDAPVKFELVQNLSPRWLSRNSVNYSYHIKICHKTLM